METYLTTEIIKALSQADYAKVLGYGAIFFIIWIEVHGMKKELKKLNLTVSTSFADGEKRFEALEKDSKLFELRLTVLEKTMRGNT